MRPRPASLWPFVILLMAASVQGAGAESASTCQLASPPPEAGEGALHAQLFKVSPRKSAMGPGFDGCQTLWLHARGEAGARAAPVEAMRLHFRRGKVVATQREDQRCEYGSDGTLSPSSAAQCRGVAPEAIASQPAGCVLARAGAPSAAACAEDD